MHFFFLIFQLIFCRLQYQTPPNRKLKRNKINLKDVYNKNPNKLCALRKKLNKNENKEESQINQKNKNSKL